MKLRPAASHFELGSDSTAKATTLSDHKRMLRALVHIREQLDEPLGPEELARVACFSPYRFHRGFTGMVGERRKHEGHHQTP
jgi:AraC-like DNA-binding protein